MTLSLDMTDPNVRSLLEQDKSRVHKPGEPKSRAMVQLAGDPEQGYHSTHRTDTHKREVIVLYKDFVMTVDVYAMDGQPIELMFICPKCRHQGRITAARKKIEYDPTPRTVKAPDGRPMRSDGTLHVEPFQCAWEMPDAGAHEKNRLHIGGLNNLCGLKLAFDGNVAKDA